MYVLIYIFASSLSMHEFVSKLIEHHGMVEKNKVKNVFTIISIIITAMMIIRN